jgi:hypothetical protein
MDNAEISKMTQQERLQAMEALWGALTHDQSEPLSPAWHEEILAVRRARIEADNATFVELDELKTRPDKSK